MRLLIILFLLLFRFASAQDSLTVNEIHDAISKGYKPGFSVYIPVANSRDILSLWKKQLENDGKTDITEKKNELALAKTVIPGITSDSIVIYSKVSGTASDTSGSTLSVFVMSRDTFVSSVSNPSTAGGLKSYMRTFAVSQYRSALLKKVNTELKKLTAMNEELKRMERENENCVKRINSNKNENARLQENITANDELLESKTGEVDQQSETVKDIPASDQKMDEEKKLKQLQKEKSKLEEELASLKKEMEKNNSQIDDLQKKLELNTTINIPARKTAIENQKEIVNNLSRKMNAIR